MKALNRLCCIQLLSLLALGLTAQEPNQVHQLQEQLRQLKETFERTLEDQRRQMEALEKKIQLLEQQPADKARHPQAPGQPASPAPADPAAPSAAQEALPRKGSWSPGDPIPLWSQGKSFLDLSMVGLFAAGGSTAKDLEALQGGAHDPNQRGFTVQNLEATFTGAVDPYFRGQANLIFQIDREGESFLEVEEAFLESLSLPGNLQLKAGQFFTEFGRLNPTHPHAWDFADQPLVNSRLLGPDGLRNPGARLSWLAPTPFYSELFLAVQNSQGETAHSFRSGHEGEPFLGRLADDGNGVRTATDLLFSPRYAMAFDLSPTQTLLAGGSGAFGPNASGTDTDTQIYGVDLFWKWKPVNHSGGFPFLSWQSEAMLRRYQAGFFSEDLDRSGTLDPGEPDLDEDGLIDTSPRETLEDYGFYTQLAYGFRKGWVAGLRGDYVAAKEADYERILGFDRDRGTRWRVSPNLTWYPSEFSKIRLQYNYDDREKLGNDHSVWLQFEFLLGTHGSHKF